MRKEFNNLVMLLQQKPYSNDIAIAIQNLENKIDEVQKRLECIDRTANDIRLVISNYTEMVDNSEPFTMTVNNHDIVLRGANDILIAIDFEDDEPIINNWYNLFEPLEEKEELKPIAVGNVEYDFPEEVYTIGNADNTEIIGDVYESVFVKLDELGVIINESDEGFPGGSQANYVVKNNIFIDIVKKQQIDLSKVPIKNEAPTMLCQDKDKHDAVKDIIAKLNAIEVDGETMQYILDQVGMSEQIAKQLSNEIF